MLKKIYTFILILSCFNLNANNLKSKDYLSENKKTKKELLKKMIGLTYFGFSGLAFFISLLRIKNKFFDRNNKEDLLASLRIKNKFFDCNNKEDLLASFSNLCIARAFYATAKVFYYGDQKDKVANQNNLNNKNMKDLASDLKNFLDKLIIFYGATIYTAKYLDHAFWTLKNLKSSSLTDRQSLVSRSLINPILLYGVYKSLKA